MDAAGGDVALQTLQLLEWRLRRLEYVFNGGSQGQDGMGSQQSVVKRLGKLEDNFARLTTKSPVIPEIMALRTNRICVTSWTMALANNLKESRHPELFESAPAAKEDELDIPTQLAMVLTEAPSFPTTASQLTQLNDLPLPPTQSFTNLIANLPRLAAIDERQIEQAREISELRKRNGLLLLKWHELFVLGQGRCWAEWDGKLKKAERKVRREEVRRGADEGAG